MTELLVADWARCLSWYHEALGLPVLMLDEPRRFALLGGEGGRIALKGGEGATARPGVLMVFRSDDLEAAHARLGPLGPGCGPILDDAEEPYRSFRVRDPEGTPIQVFAWTGPS